MNVSEANAVNEVLAFILQHRRFEQPPPTSEDARDAARWLADRARRTLSVGLDGGDVDAYWRRLAERVVPPAVVDAVVAGERL